MSTPSSKPVPYLANVECIGSDGHRFFRALTAPTLGGTWTPSAIRLTSILHF